MSQLIEANGGGPQEIDEDKTLKEIAITSPAQKPITSTETDL